MTDLDRIRQENMDNSPRRPLDSRLEKFLTLHVYLLRRSVHAVSVLVLRLFDFVLTGLGFSFSYELEDHGDWAWFKDFSLPRYGLERKD